MKRRMVLKALPIAGLLPGLTGEMFARPIAEGAEGQGQSATGSGPVFELRVYTAMEGKLNDLVKRFREHTTMLFERHGMKNVAYWVPTDDPAKSKNLIYILKHPNREAATSNWKSFQDDPEWQQVRNKSEENGKLVEKVDSTFMALTDFSAKI